MASDNPSQFSIDSLYLIVGIGSVLGGAIVALIAKIRKIRSDLVNRGKEIQAKEDELKDLKQSISDIDDKLQKLERRTDDNDESIQCLREEIPKAIGDVRESLARLEGSLDKIPKKNNKSK